MRAEYQLRGRHSRLVIGARGAVAAAHPLACGAAGQVLARGGSAVDAAIAAQAVICVVMPQAAGLGGDMLALVHQPDGAIIAINGTGATPRASLAPNRHTGGGSVTTPGLVDAWTSCHQRWGQLPLSAVLRPAMNLARNGLVVDADLRAAVAAQRQRLMLGGGDRWDLVGAGVQAIWRQRALADLLADIGVDGADAFYRGPMAVAIADATFRTGGALTAADLDAHSTIIQAPIEVGWNGGVVHVQPPVSQGVLLAMILQHLDRATDQGGPNEPGADSEIPNPADDRFDHLLVELTEAVFRFRSACGRGADLLTETLPVNRERASRRGGPRAYLHTAGVATADSQGMVVSSLISVFDDFGSAVFVPEGGFTLNNRAAGFTDGENTAGPGKRPIHTLAPMLSIAADGDVLALATPGADGQIQTLLQVLAAQRFAGADLGEAIAAPRWRSEGGSLRIESDHPAAVGLQARGHDVHLRPPGDPLFGAVVAAGLTDSRPFAAADWRRQVWSGVT